VINKNVFRLQVAVDNVKRVKVLERQNDLTGVERRVRITTAAQTSYHSQRPTFLNEAYTNLPKDSYK